MKARDFFPSHADVSRIVHLTGKVARVRRSGPREFSILLVPTGYRANPAGIWMLGRVPADRNQEYSVFTEIHANRVYSFDVAATGNMSKVPSHGRRIDFQVVRVYHESRNTQGNCSGEFGISGTVVAVEPHYIVLRSTALDIGMDRPALPSTLMAIRTRHVDDFLPGQKVLLRVGVRPDGYVRSGENKYFGHAAVLESVLFRPTGEAQSITKPVTDENKYDRRGHWRTVNGREYWVRPCKVTRRRH